MISRSKPPNRNALAVELPAYSGRFGSFHMDCLSFERQFVHHDGMKKSVGCFK